MKLLKEAEKKRDEGAIQFGKGCETEIVAAECRVSYKHGFDAGYSTAKLEAEELVKALEKEHDHSSLPVGEYYGNCRACEALAKYRGET